jgi:hypothetical protein
MKTIVTFFALFFAINLGLKAQDNGPIIDFTAVVVDYGDIVFEFTNTGTEPLIISKVYSSCGCTIPKKPEAPIAPGEKGEIQVKYDTNRVGPIRKTITVNSNATDTPIVSLKIKGTVL